MCALLYAKLEQWSEAQTVALGLLPLISVPLTRIEVLRLLARCHVAKKDGRGPGAAEQSLAEAAALAHKCGYTWMELVLANEMLALRPSAARAAELRARLAELLQQVVAPRAEITALLGTLHA